MHHICTYAQASFQCLICLDEYDPEDEVRLLTCRHGFHKTCVDTWLETGRNNCPACRSTVSPNLAFVFSILLSRACREWGWRLRCLRNLYSRSDSLSCIRYHFAVETNECCITSTLMHAITRALYIDIHIICTITLCS